MDAAPPLLGGAPPGHEAGLADLEPDAFAAVCTHLPAASVAALAAASGALRHAVASNDRLWSELYGRQFPAPWRRLTQRAAVRDRGGRQGVAPGGWRSVYLATHEACQQVRAGRGAGFVCSMTAGAACWSAQARAAATCSRHVQHGCERCRCLAPALRLQLRSIAPAERQWATDSAAVHLAAIHGSGPQVRQPHVLATGGWRRAETLQESPARRTSTSPRPPSALCAHPQRLTVTAQGSGVELRPAPELSTTKSWQLYGHSARVSAVAVLAPGAGSCAASAVRRLGVATASLDQTLRWAGRQAGAASIGAAPLKAGPASARARACSDACAPAACGAQPTRVHQWPMAGATTAASAAAAATSSPAGCGA